MRKLKDTSLGDPRPATPTAGLRLPEKRLPEARMPGPKRPDERACYPQVRRVLLCLDGSPVSEQGLQPALALARALDVPMCLLHVLEHGGLPGRAEPADPMLSDIRRLEARGYLHDLRRDVVPPDVRTAVRVVQGHVVDSIIQEAHRDGPAFVVLTRHGERGQLDHPLSSTAHEVVHRLSGPFLLIPPVAGRRCSELQGGWKTVMVPLDGSVRAECAIPAAQSIARDRGAELVLVHAVPAPELSGQRPFSREDLDLVRRLQQRNHQAAEAYLSRLRGRLSRHRVAVHTLVLQGRTIRDSLADLLQREDIGLVVACAHGATGSPSWRFGGLATHLIENSSCALVLVQDLSEANMQRLCRESTGVENRTAAESLGRLRRG
ncbi:MAG: universal stress protein [Planctomycetota bacterium]|jgi:nucleotide-binding universal stress UspA family protein